MAVIKCKMCGGDLNLQSGSTVAECEYCGTVQTVPTADNEKKITLFQRANRLRFGCEFDKAAGVYEAIVAEFPEEAEAYWGLVLCKYGIEYVDDPVTGKKIPTCHRSSFDSVLDDPNLDLALENTDAVARRVYRDEAKAIEELRKGIVEVSSKEAPYDIFICYKETDEQGGRTLDSVLAQDVYDALVEKGYRVFFSRITLEDKLGQEYEPYIFAAIHSAKIMLAFGTDYEYFNAVWVKNEWSRFLSLIASGEKKALIPCYKGIDAYDLPKEFAKLQAQDMGKVGAIQDLLRGIEKILPKKAAPVVIQEKVVVGNAGSSNKIMSLLDRGNMALEDRDWAKADSFFEDVLNNESKNAQAYLGKTLATEKCRTMDAFARKRKAAAESVQAETLSIPEKSEHIAEMVQKFAVHGYLEEETIRELYDFDRSYSSTASGRRAQYEAERVYWADHKWLSKAEKFAVGTVAQTIEAEKQHLFAQLADRVKQAEAADAKEVAQLTAAYDARIADSDAKVAQLHEDALRRKESNYQNLCEKMTAISTIADVRKLKQGFAHLGDYKDCPKRVCQCQEREDELLEADKQKVEAEINARAEAEAKRRKQKALLGVASVAVLIMAFFVAQFVQKVIKYNEAETMYQAGSYEEAIGIFQTLEGFRGSEAAIELCREGQYAQAEALLESGDLAHAAMAFGSLGDFKDARTRSFELWGKVTERKTLDAAWNTTVGVKPDGTVVAVGKNDDNQCEVADWTDIVAVDTAYGETVGLKADGTVVTTEKESLDNWKDIVAISTGFYTVGLRSDGTVMTPDGSGVANSWTDIVAISYGGGLFGLKSDGTVVTTGNGEHFAKYDVSDWTDIVAISSGDEHTVGLRADGTVVVAGKIRHGTHDVSRWRNIVAISAGEDHTVGLKSDGTVVATGDDYGGQCNVSDWRDIVAIASGWHHTVGLKSDGTVVVTEYSGSDEFYDGQCDISDWGNIKLPD